MRRKKWWKKQKISTHTSRVGCDVKNYCEPYITEISTHTSRVGCDCDSDRPFPTPYNHFYSHIPCGMWRDLGLNYITTVKISTHTSRVGCDNFYICFSYGLSNFYSHIPCGMWLSSLWYLVFLTANFYSHIPCGMWLNCASIGSACPNFYSHIPCGMWLWIIRLANFSHIFLLTHPVWDVTSHYTR